MTQKTWLALCLTSSLMLGCVGDDNNNPEGANKDTATEFNFAAMMANYADNVIVPLYRDFAEASAGLATDTGAIATYCNAIGTADEGSAREDAQAAWSESMAVWQQAELFLLGPAAANGGAMRNRIYSYGSTSPLSTCAVDQSVVLAENDSFNIQVRSFNSRGLDALEYLLFNDNLDHTCPSQISETTNWNDRPAGERKQARCDYAVAVAQDVSVAAQTLLDAWTEEGGNYRYRFVNPANQESNLSALSDALFYIETETKDAKLGIPTGLHRACSQTACPESVESKYSQTSLEHIRNNLLAFQRGFNGGDGPGFDDIIVSEGVPEIAARFNTMVDDAVNLIDTIDSPLYQQTLALQQSGDDSGCVNSAANPDSVQEVSACSLHGLLKRITDSLRTDFVTIVNLDLPDRAQSDND